MNKLAIKEKMHTVHWSSTEISSAGAWGQYFNNGYQINTNKTVSYWARAVRREKK